MTQAFQLHIPANKAKKVLPNISMFLHEYTLLLFYNASFVALRNKAQTMNKLYRIKWQDDWETSNVDGKGRRKCKPCARNLTEQKIPY